MRLNRLLPLIVTLAAGCSTIEVRQPPAALLAPCTDPDIDVTTNGALVRSLLAYRRALRLCNDDKSALREWAGQN